MPKGSPEWSQPSVRERRPFCSVNSRDHRSQVLTVAHEAASKLPTRAGKRRIKPQLVSFQPRGFQSFEAFRLIKSVFKSQVMPIHTGGYVALGSRARGDVARAADSHHFHTSRGSLANL
jgi:hypothetical protein